MVLAVDFSGLSAWADAMATILLIELGVLLLIIAALVAVLAYGARWLQMHVVPVLNTTVPMAHQALQVTNQSTDRVVRGVAEVHGVQSGIRTATRVLLFGRDGARLAPAPTSATQTTVTSAEPRQGSAATGRVGPAERRTPPVREPRQPNQPYDNMDNMAAHAG